MTRCAQSHEDWSINLDFSPSDFLDLDSFMLRETTQIMDLSQTLAKIDLRLLPFVLPAAIILM